MTDFLPKTPFPDWSGDADYPAGSDDWSASPTKIEPVFGVRSAGVTPDDQMVAQWYNWLNNKYGAMLAVLVHTPMQSWTAHAIVAGDGLSGYSTLDNGDCGNIATQARFALGAGVGEPFVTNFPERGGIFAAGDGESDFGFFSTNGDQWKVSSYSLSSDPSDACGDAIGTVVVTGLSTRKLRYSLDAFNTWNATADVAPAGGGFSSVQAIKHGNPETNRLLATLYTTLNNGNNSRVYTSDDLGVNWIARGIGTDAYNFTQVASNGKAVGSGNVVVGFAQGASCGLFVSNDAGDSFSFVRLTASGTSAGGVCYSPVWDQFMAIDNDGNMLTSADGLSWVLRVSPFTGDSGLTIGSGKPISCVGSVFAIAMNLQSANGVVGGIFYSFDIGSSWSWIPLTKAGDTTRLVYGVKAFGSRFCALGHGCLYLSAPLSNPTPDVLV